MLLFEKDWNELYPTAIVHYDCPNKSFLHYAQLLKAMGIKNWAWCLALIHSELRHVDPFNPNLTLDQQLLITLECKLNPWYYFRSVARAIGSTSDTPIYFNANRSNMALYWLFFNHITVCLLQPRQTGKTFGSTSLDTYLLNIASTGGRTLLLTKDEQLRAKTLSEIKTIEELLPFYLRQHNKHDIGNREEINVSSLDNNYKALIARNDPIAADKTGKGHTVENVRVDEFAFLFYISIALSSLLPVTTAARKTAEIVGKPYGNIFMTTAGKKDDRDGAFAFNYFNSGAPWTEFLFDCANIEELRNVIKSSSRDGNIHRVHCVFNHRQLGYTDEWLRNVAAENSSYGEAFERDYLNIWTSGSQNSPLTVEESKKVRDSQTEIKYAEISKYGQIVLRWYIREEEIKRVMLNEYTVAAVDTSDGMGKDEIALNIRHLKTGEILAVCGINEINLITVSNFFVELLKIYPKLTMIIERRNQAASIVDYMHKQLIAVGIDPFRRLFNMVVQEHMEYPERYAEIQERRNIGNENFLAQYKKYFGFTTSGGGTTSRSELYGTTFRAAVKYTGDLIKDKPTIDQLLALIIKNGRVDHPTGGHDDLCFVGSTLVRTIKGNIPISELKIGDLVLTREGYKPILYIYNREKEVISKFGLTGTANHPFITPNGEIPFEDLTLESVVYTWHENLSSIAEKRIIDILNHKDYTSKDITQEIKLMKSEGRKEKVYNLLVADCHEYFVNDILVHNCVSWLLSYWFMSQGKNLQYYGIPSNYVLSQNQVIHSHANREEMYQLELSRRAKEHIEKLIEAIRKERDPNVSERLVYEIESVKRLLGDQHEVSLSVDAMLSEIKKQKILKYSVKRSLY